MTQRIKQKERNIAMKKDWFDEHVIIDFGDSEENKKKADELKDKLKEKLEEEFKDESVS